MRVGEGGKKVGNVKYTVHSYDSTLDYSVAALLHSHLFSNRWWCSSGPNLAVFYLFASEWT